MNHISFLQWNIRLPDSTFLNKIPFFESDKRYEKRLKKIEIAASLYAEHISTFPDELEYEINFSDNSVSIYIIVNIVPINENRENLCRKMGSPLYLMTNTKNVILKKN